MPSVEEKLDSDEDELDSGNSDKSNFFYSDSAVSASEDEESGKINIFDFFQN